MTDPEYPVLLFDVGGVLVEGAGVTAMLGWSGQPSTPGEIWRRWLTSPTVRAFETGAIDDETFAGAIVTEMSLPLGPEEFLTAFDTWTVGVYPQAVALLGRIPDGYHRSILSNSNGRHWPQVERLLSIDRDFDSHFVSHLTGRIKPDAGAFQQVLDELGRTPEEVLFFDDNSINVDAAQALGIRAFVTGPDDLESRLVGLGIIGT